jgi:hypothetical protein
MLHCSLWQELNAGGGPKLCQKFGRGFADRVKPNASITPSFVKRATHPSDHPPPATQGRRIEGRKDTQRRARNLIREAGWLLGALPRGKALARYERSPPSRRGWACNSSREGVSAITGAAVAGG